jgi:hypothetical protein
MNLEEFYSLDRLVEEFNKLKIVGWKIENINLAYVSSGEITIRLSRIKEKEKENEKK